MAEEYSMRFLLQSFPQVIPWLRDVGLLHSLGNEIVGSASLNTLDSHCRGLIASHTWWALSPYSIEAIQPGFPLRKAASGTPFPLYIVPQHRGLQRAMTFGHSSLGLDYNWGS